MYTYLDIGGVCEEHAESVDAHAPATSGGETVLQSSAEIIIYSLCLMYGVYIIAELMNSKE